jgi:hypothetical protein
MLPGLCDPTAGSGQFCPGGGYTRGRVKQVPNRLSYRLTKKEHRQHEHGRGICIGKSSSQTAY